MGKQAYPCELDSKSMTVQFEILSNAPLTAKRTVSFTSWTGTSVFCVKCLELVHE